MTPEIRKTLLGLISEYGHSLTRIQGEKTDGFPDAA